MMRRDRKLCSVCATLDLSNHKQARTEIGTNASSSQFTSQLKNVVFIYYLICMGVLPICLCIPSVPGALGGQKRVTDSLRLEFDCCGPPCGS